MPRGASEDRGTDPGTAGTIPGTIPGTAGTVPSTAGTVPGTAGVADRGRRMVLWRSQPKRGEEAAFAIAAFQPLSQMHLDIRKGIHLLSPCSNTAAIPTCLFDGKLTETAEPGSQHEPRGHPSSVTPSWEGETEARGSLEVCVGKAGPRDG